MKKRTKMDHIGQRMSNDQKHYILVRYRGARKSVHVATVNLLNQQYSFEKKVYMESRFVIAEIKDILARIKGNQSGRTIHYILTFDKQVASGKKKAETINCTTLVHNNTQLESIKRKICDGLQIPKNQLPLITIHEQMNFLDLLDKRMVVLDNKHISAITIHSNLV